MIDKIYWVLLLAAICFEVCGTICMKLSRGFVKIVPSLLMFLFYIACFGVMTVVVKKIEVSTSYAIWAGVGTALVATIGMLYFNETVSFVKIVSLALVIIGVVGLNLSYRT